MEKNYAIKQFNGWTAVEGKVFLGQELSLKGAEASLQRIKAGEESPFLHAHKEHEELYVIISGKCEYQVDGKIEQVSEGCIVRVAPSGIRALRNTGDTDMVMMCIQFSSAPITSFMDDAIISQDNIKW